ncbi:putative integral membrane protein [Mycobacterium xenopi 4042]|uniref:Putative integral membrane protein n=1 Tax=Mycobacterium xenopi 4042 TaxID=1299334 RepID=X8CJU7_MYCXE|nr:putative integral membrane protein [Mycobacterium xenopi 4042]
MIWRFTGSRMLSATAERSAQRGVAVSFWMTAPTSPPNRCTICSVSAIPTPA